MAESMHARVPARHPANRRPSIPHPHLAPPPRREEALEAALEEENSGDWTPVDVPLARPASRSRRGHNRQTPAERTLRLALLAGLIVNLAVLIAPRLLPAKAFSGWTYGGDDFLLAAAVLLSGYALLAAGRLSRREDREK